MLSIEKGNLGLDIDTPYCQDGNKIDVYTSVYWTGKHKEEYDKKEEIISNWSYEDDLVKASSWCDSSGFEYWVEKQQEDNYVCIDVNLKKLPYEYTQEEIKQIAILIDSWDEYFLDNLS